MWTPEFFMGFGLGAGILAVLVVGFFMWCIHIYEKMSNKQYSMYAIRIEAAVQQLERKAAGE